MTIWGKLAGRNEGYGKPQTQAPGTRFSICALQCRSLRRRVEGSGLPDIKPENVQKLDSIVYLSDLRRVGAKVADEVKIEHFGSFIN